MVAPGRWGALTRGQLDADCLTAQRRRDAPVARRDLCCSTAVTFVT